MAEQTWPSPAIEPGDSSTADSATSARLVQADALLALLVMDGKTPDGAAAVLFLALAVMLHEQVGDPAEIEEKIAEIPALMRRAVDSVRRQLLAEAEPQGSA